MVKIDTELKANNELRCEIHSQEVLAVSVIEGSAEIFGAELALNKEYCFRGRNFSIFTWYGCKISYELSHIITSGVGQNTSNKYISAIYTSDDTPMLSYVNTHIQLEARRDIALANKLKGPRVLIMGPRDHGKTAMAQIFANYSLRLDRKPILVDLNVDHGLCSLPGCVTAIPLNKSCLSVDSDYCNNNNTPIVYNFGHTDPKENLSFYKKTIYNLSLQVNERLKNDTEANASGLIVDTCTWNDTSTSDVSQDPMNIIKFCINAFEIDIVLVAGSDKMYSTLSSALSNSVATSNDKVDLGNLEADVLISDGITHVRNADKVTVVKLAKSGGTVVKKDAFKLEYRRRKIHEYFYGRSQTHSGSSNAPAVGGLGSLASNNANANANTMCSASTAETSYSLSPSRLDMKLSTFDICRVGGVALHQTAGMIAYGDNSASKSGPLDVLPAKLTKAELMNSIIALVHSPDRMGVTEGNVAGFVYVINVDPARDLLVIMAPCPGSELPSKVAMLGSIKHVEQS